MHMHSHILPEDAVDNLIDDEERVELRLEADADLKGRDEGGVDET